MSWNYNWARSVSACWGSAGWWVVVQLLNTAHMPDVPSWVKVNPSKLHLSKFLCYEITKNSLVLSNKLSLKASHGDKSSNRFDVLNYLETPNCVLNVKVRAENHWTIMNWSDLHLWEPEKVLWDLRPLDSLFSRIGQLVRLLSSRWPPSTHYLGGTSTVLTCWVADESWWDCLEGDQQPIMWLVSQFSEDDYLVILWLASCADPIPRNRLSLQILTKGESNPGNSHLEYLCRSQKLCQRLC